MRRRCAGHVLELGAILSGLRSELATNRPYRFPCTNVTRHLPQARSRQSRDRTLSFPFLFRDGGLANFGRPANPLSCAKPVVDPAPRRPYFAAQHHPRARAFRHVADRRCRHVLPVAYPEAACLLGAAGLRTCSPMTWKLALAPFTRDDSTRSGPRPLEGGLCAALEAANRRAVRRESEPAAALLPVPGHPEAVARQQPGSISRQPARAGH